MIMFDGIAWGATYYFNVNWSPGGSRYLGVSRYGSYGDEITIIRTAPHCLTEITSQHKGYAVHA